MRPGSLLLESRERRSIAVKSAMTWPHSQTLQVSQWREARLEALRVEVDLAAKVRAEEEERRREEEERLRRAREQQRRKVSPRESRRGSLVRS